MDSARFIRYNHLQTVTHTARARTVGRVTTSLDAHLGAHAAALRLVGVRRLRHADGHGVARDAAAERRARLERVLGHIISREGPVLSYYRSGKTFRPSAQPPEASEIKG